MFSSRKIRKNNCTIRRSLPPIEEGRASVAFPLMDADQGRPYPVCGPLANNLVWNFSGHSNSESKFITVHNTAPACWSCQQLHMEGEGFEVMSCNCDPRFLNPAGGVKLQSVFVQTIPDVTLQAQKRPPERFGTCAPSSTGLACLVLRRSPINRRGIVEHKTERFSGRSAKE